MLRLPNQGKLLRLLAINLAIGLGAAAAMTAGLVLLDIGGLKTLLLSDSAGIIAIILLFFGFAVTFGGAAMAIAVWTYNHDDDDEGGGRRAPEIALPLAYARAQRR